MQGRVYQDRGFRIALLYRDQDTPIMEPVYRDRVMSIYELPNPRPYFEVVHGQCQLDVASRTALDAQCTTSATLVRRELYFPGWRSSINGQPANIGAYDNLFQTLSLPPGHSRIHFSYVPEYMEFGVGAFGLALLALTVSIIPIARWQCKLRRWM